MSERRHHCDWCNVGTYTKTTPCDHCGDDLHIKLREEWFQ